MAKTEKISLEDKLAAIQKKTGVKTGIPSYAIEPVEGLSTGNIVIDHLTGVGGLPKGRITEISGDYSTGKSSLAIQTAAKEQQRLIANNEEGYILYLDHEKTLDVDYMRNLGINTDHKSFISAQPTYIEESQEIALDLLKDLPIKMIIWDSISYMFPKARTEGEFASRMAAPDKARTLKALLDIILGPLFERKCVGVLLNHVQTTIPTGYGQIATEITGGGKGIDNASTLRLKLKKGAVDKSVRFDETSGENSKRVSGVDTRIIVHKTKLSDNAHREAWLRMKLGAGFDNTWSVIQVLKANKLIIPGSWYYFNPQGKEDLGHPDMHKSALGRRGLHGENAVLDFAASHPEWLQHITEIAEAALKENPDQRHETADLEDELDES